MTKPKALDVYDLIAKLRDELFKSSGERVVEIYNGIMDEPIEYLGDGVYVATTKCSGVLPA